MLRLSLFTFIITIFFAGGVVADFSGCPESWIDCGNGKCVSELWLCDGDNDCGNFKDEESCGSEKPQAICLSSQFQCAEDRTCIPKTWNCDGSNDCPDGSDEKNCCKKKMITCLDDDFQCLNGRCVPNRWKCDNNDDCGDNSDEIGCLHPEACDKNQVRCSSGECISLIWKCDGESDCTDGGDEEDCDKTTCNGETDLRCEDGQCIPKFWTCDGTSDCRDGTDEKNCSSKSMSCTDKEFRCQDGTCIDEVLVCDQRQDCPDGSDERNCTRLACTEFICDLSGKCIPWTKTCDGNADCTDGTDEGPLCYTACRNNGNCSQKCSKTPTGSKCSCNSGYELMDDGVTCKDINECSMPGYCSQLCNNTIGGVECSCVDAYVLTQDRRKCMPNGGQATLVYLLSDSIGGLQMSTNYHTMFYSDEGGDMRGLDYDAEEFKFFWTDWKLSTLNSYAPITNERITLLTTPIRPTSVKWDWLTRTFFYTNDDGSIVACNESGKYCATAILNAGYFSSGFDISPKNGIMFWSIWNVFARSQWGIIERADLDGSERVVIVTNDLYFPSCVTVDEVTERIYWADLKTFVVEFADFEGRQRKILLEKGQYKPLSMAIFEDYLFFSNYDNNTIYRCDKFIGEDCIPVHSSNVKANAIMIFHKAKQSKGENRCSNNKCHHLCLPNHSGSSCKCSDGYELINSTCSLISTNTYQVHESPSTVDTNEHHETSIAKESEVTPASTPTTETNVIRIWGKHLLPVIIGKREDYI
ncbi:very low-density lipoprotein receptor [Parasteatoda tepidariorum]|uniref:very low-density lipoprotein receptor n=1 Tax=Parasteatoda tepidariorum TaxID=114398 RepID=UPI0039BCE00B